MSRKKHIVKAVVFLFMVFAMILSTSTTFAYWSSDIIVENEANNKVNASARIGEWSQVYEWQPDTTYYIGDRVIYNGKMYTAKKQNENIMPESIEKRNWPSYWQK